MYEQVSEVARLRESILLESQASWWALYGLSSGNAQHEFITARLKKMGEYHGRLATLVGEESATEYLCEAFEEGQHERIGK
jgi:hypothetical protein